MKKSFIQRLSIALIAAVGSMSYFAMAHADDPVAEQSVLRPVQVDAKVKGCQISEPGTYRMSVGDTLEVDYSYPIVPTAIPKKVTAIAPTVEPPSVVARGPLAVVRLSGGKPIIGSGTKVVYFTAKRTGDAHVSVEVDDESYKYHLIVE